LAVVVVVVTPHPRLLLLLVGPPEYVAWCTSFSSSVEAIELPSGKRVTVSKDKFGG